MLASQEEEPLDVVVLDESVPDVIDRAAIVGAARLGQERDSRERPTARNEIQEFSDWRLPHSMQLSFDKHPRQFPNCPSDDSLPAVGGDVVGNDLKALVQGLTPLSRDGDRDGVGAGDNRGAEIDDMIF